MTINNCTTCFWGKWLHISEKFREKMKVWGLFIVMVSTKLCIIYIMLTRDDRHNFGQSSRTIAKQLGCGKSTVNDILNRLHETHSLTPKKPTGRPPLLNSPAQQELKAFVQENGENRRLCSTKIATV